MPADHQDDDLKSIYRALAEGRITEDAAQAAEEAVHARRAARDRIAAPPASRPALSRRRRREKVFGAGRPRPMDRNAKTRIMHLARALTHRTEPGKHYGVITAKAVGVLEALLWGFHNARSGLCFPSYERIAEAAHCARSTVYEAIAALEAAGLLTWVNRLKRVREWAPGLPGVGATRVRVLRTSNAYAFADPGNSSKSDFPSGTSIQVPIPLFASDAGAAKGLAERLTGGDVGASRRGQSPPSGETGDLTCG